MGEPTELGTAALHILVALGGDERHGYAIMHEIEEATGGRLRVAPGTLYTNLKRLLGQGFIEECGERPDPALDDHRRRYYRLTESGRAALASEVDGLERLVARARPLVDGIGR